MSTPSYKNKLLNSIVISGWPAVGKTTIATALAREFGYKHFNGGDVLKLLAAEKGYKVSGNNWWDTEEAKNFMIERESNSYFDIEVDRKLVELVRMGKVVVTSYTLPWLVPESIKIWLKGSRSNRIKRMAKRDNLDLNQARNIIQQRDNNNVLIYQNLYGYEFGKDLSVFDFVLDTDLLDLESVLLISKTIVKNLRT
ncbi:MAG TPA: cytidylate kinase family protein [Nitrososphaeraceae archaeon]|nr:cytidylate kinase family protein [Nitrososphaeraceae archaeon]